MTIAHQKKLILRYPGGKKSTVDASNAKRYVLVIANTFFMLLVAYHRSRTVLVFAADTRLPQLFRLSHVVDEIIRDISSSYTQKNIDTRIIVKNMQLL